MNIYIYDRISKSYGQWLLFVVIAKSKSQALDLILKWFNKDCWIHDDKPDKRLHDIRGKDGLVTKWGVSGMDVAKDWKLIKLGKADSNEPRVVSGAYSDS